MYIKESSNTAISYLIWTAININVTCLVTFLKRIVLAYSLLDEHLHPQTHHHPVFIEKYPEWRPLLHRIENTSGRGRLSWYRANPLLPGCGCGDGAGERWKICAQNTKPHDGASTQKVGAYLPVTTVKLETRPFISACNTGSSGGIYIFRGEVLCSSICFGVSSHCSLKLLP